VADYRKAARRAAQRYGLDPDVFERQIEAESGFNPNAVSPKGATGIAQIMPATARGWGVNPRDPIASLNAAAEHMAADVKRYGSYENALRAYNAGPAAIQRSKSYAETNAYVAKILGGRTPSTSGVGGSTGGEGAFATTTRKLVAPAQDLSQERALLALSFLSQQNGNPANFVAQLQGLQDVPAQYQTTRTVGQTTPESLTPGSSSSAGGRKGTANFEGTKVAGWIAPILQYARERGWQGKVNSGFRSYAEQQHIYNSGVRPAAVPGTSNHEGDEFPRGAVDVSDAQQLSRILRNSPYAQKLIWAGAKDPVHFSHPHNGSY